MTSTSLDGLTILRFILDPAEIGGAVLDVDTLDRALARRHEVHVHKVFLSTESKNGWTETIGPSTVSYYPVHYSQERVGKERAEIIARLRGILTTLVERHRPDLVANHVPEIPAGVLVSRFAREQDIPLFIQLHGGDMPKLKLPYKHKKMLDEVVGNFRQSARLADVVASVSASADNLLPDRDVKNLWTGADPFFWDPSRVQHGYLRDRFDLLECHPIMTLPARIVVEKGHKLLLDALQRLFRRGHDFRVVFAGSATEEMREQLDDYVLKNGFSGVVHNLFDATQSEMRWVYKDTDVVVLPGFHFEGCPRCLLEAQLMETPVVASDSGGPRESFVDGETGFLFPVGDEEALADALEPLLTDPALRQRLGKAGRNHVLSRFGLDALSRRHEAVYKQLLRRPVAVPA